jgi:hypothetical protein
LARYVYHLIPHLTTAKDDAATQAAPLIASPTMIVALLSPEVREASSTYRGRGRTTPMNHTNAFTALEVYFSRTLGFTLLTLGALTILLTGSVPLSSRLNEGTDTSHFTSSQARD